MKTSLTTGDEPLVAEETGYEQVFFSASDGLRLAVRDYGRNHSINSTLEPVVCLPGLTRNAADFHQLALHLSQDDARPRRVVCFDYRGRGLSDWDPQKENYNILTEADDVLSGCTALGIGHAAFIGTSRGALIIHVLGAMRPGVLSSALLNDAGPVVEGAGLAQIMAYHDRMKSPRDYAEAAQTLKTLQGGAFSALENDDWEDLARAMYARKGKRLAGNFDPALIDMLRAVDLNVPLPTMWPQFDGLKNIPMLAIRGANSALFSEETLNEMARRHNNMQHYTAEGQGHAPILHIGALPQIITDFLNQAET